MFGCLFYSWMFYFVYHWTLWELINPFKCKTPYWVMRKCSPLLSWNFLDVDITSKDHQIEHGGNQNVSGDFGAI